MKDFERLLDEGIETAYGLQTRGSQATTTAVKERVIRRGRRRRAVRGAGAALLSVALVAGAASAGSSLLRTDSEVAGRAVPELGAERVLEGGGPLATDGRSLWIGNGQVSNTRGDENSIARMDLASGRVVDGDPAVQLPHAMSVGDSGVWTVSWTGDMPMGGEGNPVRGVIERVDPVTLERTGHIAREDSAPYDVAVGKVGGREVAWVVDFGRDELLEIDGETMEIAAVQQTPHRPVSVHVNGRFVYVTSSDDHVVQRIDTATRETTEFPVPDCANDVTVAYGSLWVADYCGDAVVRIDETGSGDPVSIDVGEAPTSVEAAQGLVWVATQEDVVRVDPGTDEVVGNRIFVKRFFMGTLLYAGGDMWLNASEAVYRLGEDAPPATPEPPQPTEEPRDEPVPEGVERVEVARPPHAVAAAGDWVWTGAWDVERIGAATGEVAAKIELGQFVHALRFDEEANLLWALVEIAEEETAGLVAIDPESDEIVLGPVPVAPSNVSAQHFDAAGGVAWVGGRGGTLSRVDVAVGEVTETDLSEHYDPMFNQEGAFHVAATGDSVLVLATDGTVVRVDVASGKHAVVEDLGFNVSDVESDGGMVWVVKESPRGGIELETLYAATGKRANEPISVGKYGFARVSEHDGTVWVARGGADGALVTAYVGGEVVKELRLPGGELMTDVDAGASGLWLTTGQPFLYRIPSG